MKTATPPASSKSKVKPVPDGMHTVTPHLVCDGAAKAIEFYKKAFGAIEMARLPDAKGRILHAAIKIGDSWIFLNDEFPEMGSVGPKARGGASVTIHLYVEDADAAFARATKAGATVKMPLADMFWGDRYGLVTDPFGHDWSIATHIADPSIEEIRESAKHACD